MAKRKREVEEEEAPRRKKKGSGGSGVSTVVTLDFTKDTSEGRKKFKEGDYPFKVKTVKMGKSEQKGTPYCQVNLVHAKGSKYAGDPISDRVYITDAALWRIRALFEACGKPLAKKKTQIDFKDLVGADLWATVVDNEYTNNDGKSRTVSIIGDYLEEEPDLKEEEDDDDEDDDDEEEDEDLEDMDVDDDL